MEADTSARCVVLTGAGKRFCAGRDVKGFAAAGEAVPAFINALTTPLHAAILAFCRMRKPLITAVNGPAAGAGLGLAIIGEVVLAARSARFSSPYRSIGLTPERGVSWVLPRLIGLRGEQEMALADPSVAVDEAVMIGLATRAVVDEQLAVETMRLAEKLAASADQALAETRILLLATFNADLGSHPAGWPCPALRARQGQAAGVGR